eukprot:COSAG06_NODE_40117_length_405_cov_0.862745_1_plen_109_part_01
MFLFRTVLVPFCLRVAVEVNRPCLGRHPISQRAAALDADDCVIVVVDLTVVDGQAVVEAAGGREELRARVPEMPWNAYHRSVRESEAGTAERLRGRTFADNGGNVARPT